MKTSSRAVWEPFAMKQYTGHTSKIKRASKKKLDKSRNPSEGVVQRRTQAKRTRFGLDVSHVYKELDHICDVVTSHGEEEPGECRRGDGGLDDSDERCCSPSESHGSQQKPKTTDSLCPSCRKVYQRAKSLKTPIKDKLLDNDPTSLTCDNWVLLKKWKASRLPESRGKLSHSLLLVQSCLKGKRKAKQNERKNSCSRPHIFLHRNLRRPHKVPARKEAKRNQCQRASDDSQGCPIAKQKRLCGKRPPQYKCGNCTDKSSLHSTCAGLDVDTVP
ncbi:uncharacterized protein LOC133397641 isoform X1 [Phycodurus eques]|uniref:uncharacterized protein LOC133397641 isoform X1 n=1 Tax=Phycodurus eques TaxID=693459 RepID=UPI002ACE6B56|nr:uncharacterized protein LOC133397641 isoform X1 [Phycodurus eques]